VYPLTPIIIFYVFLYKLQVIVYRAIPFVFELKTLLDFICTDTALIFKAFLKLEDLYAELFLVKCRILKFFVLFLEIP
jgi:hypothetical protein